MKPGHYLTWTGKRLVIGPIESKIEVGLFRSDQEFPNWIWDNLTLPQLFDVVREVQFSNYERKTIGKLKLDRSWRDRTATYVAGKPQAQWFVKEKGVQIDGAFFITKRDQILLSVDLFPRIIYTEGNRGLVYNLSEGGLYVIR